MCLKPHTRIELPKIRTTPTTLQWECRIGISVTGEAAAPGTVGKDLLDLLCPLHSRTSLTPGFAASGRHGPQKSRGLPGQSTPRFVMGRAEFSPIPVKCHRAWTNRCISRLPWAGEARGRACFFGQCKTMVREHRHGLGEGPGAPSTLSNPSWEEEECKVGLEGSYLKQAVGAWLHVRLRCLPAQQAAVAMHPTLLWHIKTVNGWKVYYHASEHVYPTAR